MFFHRLHEEIIRLPGDRYLFRYVGLLHSWRIQREYLHIDADGVHLSNTLVADFLKLLPNPGALGPRIAESLSEFLAWTGQKSRADEMFFKSDGSHFAVSCVCRGRCRIDRPAAAVPKALLFAALD